MSDQEARARAAAEQWLAVDFDPQTRNVMSRLLQTAEWETILQLSHPRVAFSTAGLRAKMHAGFAGLNSVTVAQTSEGLARKLKSCCDENSSVMIGYDGRHNSRLFASVAAVVFSSHGFHVHTFPEPVPTPIVSFGVRHLGCALGVVLTASHNPKEYNGYKVYGRNGAQIIPPFDSEVAGEILRLAGSWRFSGDLSSIDLMSIPRVIDVSPIMDAYVLAVARDFQWTKLRLQLPVVYTALHGVGSKLVRRVTQATGLPAFIHVPEQDEPDPEFSTTKFPNPEEGTGTLSLAYRTAEASGACYVLANDPDADRLAIAERLDGHWRLFTGNELAVLLTQWIIDHDKGLSLDASKRVFISSTVSSKAVEAMALANGYQYYETLTGFKWMGNLADRLLKEGTTLALAFEVELGFMMGLLSFDKDGIRIIPTLMEMLYSYHEQGVTLASALTKLYTRYGFFDCLAGYVICDLPGKMLSCFNAIRHPYPNEILGSAVRVRDLTMGFDSTTQDNVPLLPVSRDTQMITFTLKTGDRITLRGSGTEPKLKYYLEVKRATAESARSSLVELRQYIFEHFLCPERYGFTLPEVV